MARKTSDELLDQERAENRELVIGGGDAIVPQFEEFREDGNSSFLSEGSREEEELRRLMMDLPFAIGKGEKNPVPAQRTYISVRPAKEEPGHGGPKELDIQVTLDQESAKRKISGNFDPDEIKGNAAGTIITLNLDPEKPLVFQGKQIREVRLLVPHIPIPEK